MALEVQNRLTIHIPKQCTLEGIERGAPRFEAFHVIERGGHVDVRTAVPALPIHLNEVFALTHPSKGRSVCTLLTRAGTLSIAGSIAGSNSLKTQQIQCIWWSRRYSAPLRNRQLLLVVQNTFGFAALHAALFFWFFLILQSLGSLLIKGTTPGLKPLYHRNITFKPVQRMKFIMTDPS